MVRVVIVSLRLLSPLSPVEPSRSQLNYYVIVQAKHRRDRGVRCSSDVNKTPRTQTSEYLQRLKVLKLRWSSVIVV
jgi:hypothetical protein